MSVISNTTKKDTSHLAGVLVIPIRYGDRCTALFSTNAYACLSWEISLSSSVVIPASSLMA